MNNYQTATKERIYLMIIALLIITTAIAGITMELKDIKQDPPEITCIKTCLEYANIQNINISYDNNMITCNCKPGKTANPNLELLKSLPYISTITEPTQTGKIIKNLIQDNLTLTYINQQGTKQTSINRQGQIIKQDLTPLSLCKGSAIIDHYTTPKINYTICSDNLIISSQNNQYGIQGNYHHDAALYKSKIYTIIQEKTLNKPCLLIDKILIHDPKTYKTTIIDTYQILKEHLNLTLDLKGESTCNDITHTNSIYLINDTHFMLSLKNQNIIAIINHDNSRIDYILKDLTHAQHQPILINNTILVFDNHYKNKTSRIIIINITDNTITWQHPLKPDPEFYTDSMGQAQILPNGNILTVLSESKRIKEITLNHTTIWEYDPGQIIYRIRTSWT